MNAGPGKSVGFKVRNNVGLEREERLQGQDDEGRNWETLDYRLR